MAFICNHKEEARSLHASKRGYDWIVLSHSCHGVFLESYLPFFSYKKGQPSHSMYNALEPMYEPQRGQNSNTIQTHDSIILSIQLSMDLPFENNFSDTA